MKDSTPTSDTSSRRLSLRTSRDREVAQRETGETNNLIGGSEYLDYHHQRPRSSDTSTSGDGGRNRHWRTILGHSPHMASASVPSAGNQPSQAAQQRRVLPTPLWSPRSRANASDLGELPTTVRRRYVDALTQSSGQLPARIQSTRPFPCHQCARRFERRGHLKVSVALLLKFFHGFRSCSDRVHLTCYYPCVCFRLSWVCRPVSY